jgi:hypothetical protein
MSTSAIHRCKITPRRADILVGLRGPTYTATVTLDGAWAHLTDVHERIFADFFEPRSDRTLRASSVREIRWRS